MTIVFASHSPFDECLVVGAHHLARTLAEAGHQVWHIGPPVTPGHFLFAGQRKYRDRLRRSFREPEEIEPNLMSVHPFSVVPWQVAKWTMRFGNLFVRWSNMPAKLKEIGARGEVDVLFVDDPRFLGLEKLFPPKRVFYRATDFYSEMKTDPQLIAAERQLLKNCSGVIATSQPVLTHVRRLRPGLPSLLLENGVDWQHFSRSMAEPEELKPIPHPRIVYAGAIDFRFDFELLDQMAKSLPGVHFVIIGPGQVDELQALRRPNLHALGPKPYRSLPGFLQHFEIGLLPLVDNVANSGRSPIKLYEYGAAGLPVLARHTSELERRAEPFLQLFFSSEEAVTLVKELLQTGPDRQAISESCQAHSWKKKIVTLVEFVRRTSAVHRTLESVSGGAQRKLDLLDAESIV